METLEHVLIEIAKKNCSFSDMCFILKTKFGIEIKDANENFRPLANILEEMYSIHVQDKWRKKEFNIW